MKNLLTCLFLFLPAPLIAQDQICGFTDVQTMTVNENGMKGASKIDLNSHFKNDRKKTIFKLKRQFILKDGWHLEKEVEFNKTAETPNPYSPFGFLRYFDDRTIQFTVKTGGLFPEYTHLETTIFSYHLWKRTGEITVHSYGNKPRNLVIDLTSYRFTCSNM